MTVNEPFSWNGERLLLSFHLDTYLGNRIAEIRSKEQTLALPEPPRRSTAVLESAAMLKLCIFDSPDCCNIKIISSIIEFRLMNSVLIFLHILQIKYAIRKHKDTTAKMVTRQIFFHSIIKI